MVPSVGSKQATGKAGRAGLAGGGGISESICNRRATRPPAHFQRNPPGRGRLAVFPRCSLITYRSSYARRPARIATRSVAGGSRLEKQPTDRRRRHHYMRDGKLAFIAHKSLKSCEQCRLWPQNPPASPENSTSQRRNAFYNCSRNCSSRSTSRPVLCYSLNSQARARQSVGPSPTMTLSCKPDGLLWVDLFLYNHSNVRAEYVAIALFTVI